MDVNSIIINACITVFALGLLIVSLLCYKKFKNPKLPFVSAVFLLLFIKGIILSLGLFFDEIAKIGTGSFIGLFDLGILVLLFLATLKG